MAKAPNNKTKAEAKKPAASDTKAKAEKPPAAPGTDAPATMPGATASGTSSSDSVTGTIVFDNASTSRAVDTDPATANLAVGTPRVSVRSRSPAGRRRAGMAFHHSEETILSMDDVTLGLLQVLLADPDLVVKVVDD